MTIKEIAKKIVYELDDKSQFSIVPIRVRERFVEDKIDKLLEEIVPKTKPSSDPYNDRDDIARMDGWNDCREDIINKIAIIKK